MPVLVSHICNKISQLVGWCRVKRRQDQSAIDHSKFRRCPVYDARGARNMAGDTNGDAIPPHRKTRGSAHKNHPLGKPAKPVDVSTI